MRQFGVTITQTSGSGSGSDSGPGSGSSLIEATAALELMKKSNTPPVQFVDASWFVHIVLYLLYVPPRASPVT